MVTLYPYHCSQNLIIVFLFLSWLCCTLQNSQLQSTRIALAPLFVHLDYGSAMKHIGHSHKNRWFCAGDHFGNGNIVEKKGRKYHVRPCGMLAFIAISWDTSNKNKVIKTSAEYLKIATPIPSTFQNMIPPCITGGTIFRCPYVAVQLNHESPPVTSSLEAALLFLFGLHSPDAKLFRCCNQRWD